MGLGSAADGSEYNKKKRGSLKKSTSERQYHTSPLLKNWITARSATDVAASLLMKEQ